MINSVGHNGDDVDFLQYCNRHSPAGISNLLNEGRHHTIIGTRQRAGKLASGDNTHLNLNIWRLMFNTGLCESAKDTPREYIIGAGGG